MKYLRRPVCLLVLFFLFSLTQSASAAVDTWTALDSEGTIGNLVADPSNPETVYAGTSAGIYKTTDGGDTWVLISPAGVEAWVLAIVGDTLYARFPGRGPARSSDEGQTWSSIPGLPPGISEVAADPRFPNRIWAASGSKLFLSTDGGATWHGRKRPVNKRRQPLTDLDVDPAGPWVYVLNTNGFFRSTDSGKTWQLGQGIRGVSLLWQAAVDPTNPSVLFLSTTTALFRSLDRGAKWTRVGAGAIDGYIRDIAARDGRVYISLFEEGIFYSSNQGATWTQAVQGPEEPGPLAVAPGVTYVAGLEDGQPFGLYRSFDQGATWERTANEGLPDLGQ
jgi:photosystem II stability/assembly factor-like uncharacterized protein